MENFWIKTRNDEREQNGSLMTAWLDVDLPSSEFKKMVEELLAAPGNRKLVGIRALAEGEQDVNFLARDNVKSNVNLLANFDISFELLIRTANFSSAEELVKSCPNTRFVLNHMGKPDVTGSNWADRSNWEHGITLLSQLQNVHCKLSGFYAGI